MSSIATKNPLCWRWGHRLCLLCGFLVAILSTPAYAEIKLNERNGSIWLEQPHPTVETLSASAGLGYYYRPPAGFPVLDDTDQWLPMAKLSLYSHSIPLLSRISWQSSTSFSLTEEPLTDERLDHAAYNGFAELRLPFTLPFLSHDTSFYLQYRRSAYRYGAEANDAILYGDGASFQRGDPLTIGSTTQYFAIAINTPITEENSHDSYSRFGIYAQITDRARSVDVAIDNMPENLILQTDERQFGIFYDIKKPVFVEGFILHLYLGAGYGFQDIRDNVYGYKSGDFDSSTALLCLNVETELAYRYSFTENFGVRAGISYSYDYLDSLKSAATDSASLNNAGVHLWGGNVTFDLLW
jgi:hypothetical protein